MFRTVSAIAAVSGATAFGGSEVTALKAQISGAEGVQWTSRPAVGNCNVENWSEAPAECCAVFGATQTTQVPTGCNNVGVEASCQHTTPDDEERECGNGGFFCDEDGEYRWQGQCLQGCWECEEKGPAMTAGQCYRGNGDAFVMANKISCANNCNEGTVRMADGSCSAMITTGNILSGSPLITPMNYESRNGLLEVWMTFDRSPYEDPFFTCSDGARMWDGEMVSPTWTIFPGDKMKIHLYNALDADPEAAFAHGTTNLFLGINITNMHVHGLHVSAREPQDEVLLNINGGESYEYVFDVPTDHMPGHHWYHPHRHGASTFHTVSSFGNIVIKSPPNAEYGFQDLPVYLEQMREVLFTINMPIFEQMSSWYSNNFETSNNVRRITKDNYKRVAGIDIELPPCLPKFPGAEAVTYALVNAQHQPFVKAFVGEPVELKMVAAEWNAQHNVTVEGCDMQLMSKDGVPLYDAPRKIRSAILPPGARGGVAVLCSTAGEKMILDHNFSPPLVIATMRVYDQQRKEGIVTEEMLDALPDLTVAWPYYLTDLTTMPERQFVKNEIKYQVTEPPEDPENIEEFPWIKAERLFSAIEDRPSWGYEFESWFIINGDVFDHHTPTFAFNYDDKVQTLIAGPDSHPHHQHVNPFQIHKFYNYEGTESYDPKNLYDNWYQVKDWHDIFQMKQNGEGEPALPGGFPGIEIRWRVADYDNFIMVNHCHILIHEDHGMMTWYAIGSPLAEDSGKGLPDPAEWVALHPEDRPKGPKLTHEPAEGAGNLFL